MKPRAKETWIEEEFRQIKGDWSEKHIVSLVILQSAFCQVTFLSFLIVIFFLQFPFSVLILSLSREIETEKAYILLIAQLPTYLGDLSV